MNKQVVRTLLLVVGALVVVVGAVFTGQGAGVIPGSFMTGDRFWFTVGVIMLLVGGVLLLLGLARRRT